MSAIGIPMLSWRTKQSGKTPTGSTGWLRSLTAGLAMLAAFVAPARATVTAYTGTIPSDEVTSPYFTTYVNNMLLHTYQTPVRSVSFVAFTSGFTGVTYDPAAGAPYNTENLGTASFASFMLSGTTAATVAISFPLTLANGHHPVLLTDTAHGGGATIRPSGSAAYTMINSNTMSFQVTPSSVGQQFTVEFDGDWLNSIHIFVNPNDPPPTGTTLMPSTQASPTTQASLSGITGPIIFGPGDYWISGSLSFPTGGEVYLSDGAFLKRTLSVPNPDHSEGAPPNIANSGPMLGFGNAYPNVNMSINVHGPGIIDGTGTQQYASSIGCGVANYPITVTNASTAGGNTINFSSFIVRNACSWNFPLGNVVGSSTSPVTINNIKILGFSGNTKFYPPGSTTSANEAESDGIDILDSQWVTVEHSFIRTMDDLIVVYQNRSAPIYETNNINANHNILWNEYAHAMLVGPEQYNGSDGTPATQNVTFDSNTVIHDTGAAFLMGVYNYAPGTVRNLTWSNINVEENRSLISLGSALGTGATGAPPTIGTVTFSNINSVTQTPETIPGTNVVASPNIQLFVRLPNSDMGWYGSGGSVITGSTFTHVYVGGTWTAGSYTGGTWVDSNTVAADPAAGGGLPVESTVLSTAEWRTTSGPYTFNSAYTADDIAVPAFNP